jgi:hypothetical protein
MGIAVITPDPQKSQSLSSDALGLPLDASRDHRDLVCARVIGYREPAFDERPTKANWRRRP